MKLKKKIAMAAVFTTMAASLAGCGGSDESGSGSWNSSNEITVVSREDGSGTRTAFVELFGVEEDGVDNTTDEANITSSTEVMLSTVSGDDYAIGYVSLGSLNDSVKAVKVDGAQASEENIKSGEYKVSRPFNIAVKNDVSDVTSDFINFILSTEGQKVISDNDYISLDDVSDFISNGATGTIKISGSSSITPVMEKLKEAYLEINTGAVIEVQASDSSSGMTDTINGVSDIGMASRQLKESELEELTPIVIATDGIAVIVNKNNTVDELSQEQVKAIFVGDSITWDDVK